jgi:hypothetical protein
LTDWKIAQSSMFSTLLSIWLLGDIDYPTCRFLPSHDTIRERERKATMGTQIVEYSYSGDEEVWRETIETFFANIAADPEISKGFTYQVFVRDDGVTRLHIPVWRDQSVLERLQAQPFFREFADTVKGFAGDTLKITKPVLLTNP